MREQLPILMAALRRVENRLNDLFIKMEELDGKVEFLVQEGLQVTLQLAQEGESGEEEAEVAE